jgi:alpha-1,3-fucosyltransferase
VPSNRKALVGKLQSNGIDVNILGKCSKQKCKDYIMVMKMSKFYLSFENSLCTDYVTEKVFRPMLAFIVPVIFSGANLTRFLPPRSYIDANSFETAEDLAKHIKYLSDNPRELVKYFWWKKHYSVREQYAMENQQLCKICKKLNEPNLWERKQFIPSIKNWYGKGMCKSATIKF